MTVFVWKKIKYLNEIQDLPSSELAVSSAEISVVVGSHFGSKDVTSAVQLHVSWTQPSLGIHFNQNKAFILRFAKIWGLTYHTLWPFLSQWPLLKDAVVMKFVSSKNGLSNFQSSETHPFPSASAHLSGCLLTHWKSEPKFPLKNLAKVWNL